MKKKNKFKKFYNDPNFPYAVVVLFLIIVVGSLIPSVPNIKITKNVCQDVEYLNAIYNHTLIQNVTVSLCSQEEVKTNIINFCYSINDCGKIQITEKLWREGWLNQYCEVLNSNCTYVKKPDKINTSKDYVGDTIQAPNCLNIEDCFDLVCKGPIKYKCQDYTIEVTK